MVKQFAVPILWVEDLRADVQGGVNTDDGPGPGEGGGGGVRSQAYMPYTEQ